MALTDSATALYNATNQFVTDSQTLLTFFHEAVVTKGVMNTSAGPTYLVDPDHAATNVALVNADLASVLPALAQVKSDLGL